MTDPYPFLNEAPEGFERTNELKWIAPGTPSEPTPAVLSYRYDPVQDHHCFDKPVYVLCQKWHQRVDDQERGQFVQNPVWVRIPIETP